MPTRSTESAPPVVDADLAALAVALERISSWVRRVTPPGEFNLVAMSVLDAVVQDGPLRISALVLRERISQPGMTSVVTRLAEAGLVHRQADPLDGRVALVAATDAGRDHLAARHATRAAALAEHIGQLSARRQARLYAAIDSLNSLGTTLPAGRSTAGTKDPT
jgi:DNA-binding MarR family transcriptional regulator